MCIGLKDINKQRHMTITSLKNIHNNEDVYVLGAGPSLNYIDINFFNNKISIGINKIHKIIPCNYVIVKDTEKESHISNIPKETQIIIAKWSQGRRQEGSNELYIKSITNRSYFVYDHVDWWPRTKDIDITMITPKSNKLVNGISTIISATHMAAYMGAKNIFICGHDLKNIEGKQYIDNYNDRCHKQELYTANSSESQICKFQTLVVCEKLRKEFGCNIVSINPRIF